MLTLGTALALRLWIVLTHTYIVFPDETFQYLEPAHRLVFGSGVLTWEYIDGIRSWLLPGVVAGVMWVTALLSPAPQTYVLAVRICCIVASLSVPYLGFRFAERRFGLPAAVVTGLLGALWYELVYYAPVVLTEPLAAYAAFWALWLGEARADGAASYRRLLSAGALFGLAACLRYQYAPALALAALWQHGRDRRALLAVLYGGVAVVALAGGVLDGLTWGTPFQSVWLNFQRNAIENVSGAMGAEPWYFTIAYFLAAWGPLTPLLVALALLGAIRLPALGIAAAVTIVLHAMTPHKEVRFIFLAIAAMPVLIGLGTGRVLTLLPKLRKAPAVAAGLALMLAAGEALTAYAGATPPDAWHHDRSTVLAFYAANADPGLCGLGVRSLWVYRSGGYTYLHRDVPIYFETFDAAQVISGLPFRFRLKVLRDGHAVPQYPDVALAGAAARFNVLIGAPWDRLPGFTQTACFGADDQLGVAACLFRRPGGCE